MPLRAAKWRAQQRAAQNMCVSARRAHARARGARVMRARYDAAREAASASAYGCRKLFVFTVLCRFRWQDRRTAARQERGVRGSA
jgi:hypothetical protein